MKPAFALDFRDTLIRLLHRTGAGWHEVGQVSIEAPDLTEALGYLRATALGLSPRGISTKLVIPNDQILYTQVHAPGPDAAKRRSQIKAALEGRTPYAVKDLVFDWSGTGDEVHVAVIARETLTEAEAFAAENRFNPVSFVAAPEEGRFKGEPWFGLSSLAPSLLAPGEKVERDQDPVQVVQRSFAPEPARPAAVEPAPVEPEPVEPEPVEPEQAEVVDSREPEDILAEDFATEAAAPPPAPVAAPKPEIEPEPEVEPEPTVEPKPEPTPEELPTPLPEPDYPTAPDVEPDDLPIFRPTPTEIPDLEPAPVSYPDSALRPAVSAAMAAVEMAEEAPMALDVAQDEQPQYEEAQFEPPLSEGAATESSVPVIDPSISDDIPPALATPIQMAFSSRRGADAQPRPAAAGKPPILGAAPSAKMVARPSAARPLPAAPSVTATRPATPPRLSFGDEAKTAGAAKALRGLGALVTAPGIAGSKARKVVPPPTVPDPRIAPVAGSAAKVTAAITSKAEKPTQRPGIGLGGRAAPVRGKPRHLGLILTGVLLLLLALVAAWSSFSLASWQGSDAAIETAAVDAAAVDAGSDVPDPADEMLADMQDPEAIADGMVVDPAESDLALTEGDPADAPPADVAATDVAVATQELATAPATDLATEAAPAGTPSADPQDEIFLATMDAAPNAPDPLSLPQPDARGDPLPAAQPAPPPFGTVYQFDADGLIRPTPEGIITPEGVLLIAGKPPLLPPQRPATLATAPDVANPDAPAAEATDATATAPEAAFPSDPALADKRPKIRPAGLAAPAAPGDDASLAPAAGTRVAGLRPQPRPASILAVTTATEAAETAVQNASLAAAALNDPNTSPLAVAISRKPAARPADLSRAVEAAVAAAVRTPEPEAPAQDAAPEADNEPETASAAPKLPTSASVAKQATFKNAINLSKVNLIGVYGTQSNRYALVRQANGKYKKVKVGDSIDGGKVAAITANELRYQKGSKMLTLQMPEG
jgi:hypothetical protein